MGLYVFDKSAIDLFTVLHTALQVESCGLLRKLNWLS